MSSTPKIPSSVPTPAERFEEAVAALDRAHNSGVGVDIAFARRQLAEVSWNLAHIIADGLRAQVKSDTDIVLTTRGKVA